MINLDGVTVVYGRTVALDDLTLEIGTGVTGVFGPNASGKSTLLRVLAGLLKPTRGRVELGGTPLALANEAFRHLVGYAGHEPGLYARLTVRENLALFARLYGVGSERIEVLLDDLGIAERAATPVGELSAGLKRRASVARALLHDPRLLLLDEPYANLDDEAADLVSRAIQRWVAPDRCAVMATHGAKRVKEFADASLILKRGRPVSYRRRVAGAVPS
ncbi:MAG: heme ABC exporter ATP-binding protein CcmA [Actinomycetota bacterium]|nr:heme ABC exporter ATP-binding protein CcmA [Actinomycetota bacterium]